VPAGERGLTKKRPAPSLGQNRILGSTTTWPLALWTRAPSR